MLVAGCWLADAPEAGTVCTTTGAAEESEAGCATGSEGWLAGLPAAGLAEPLLEVSALAATVSALAAWADLRPMV